MEENGKFFKIRKKEFNPDVEIIGALNRVAISVIVLDGLIFLTLFIFLRLPLAALI